jgi:hypothetical protein
MPASRRGLGQGQRQQTDIQNNRYTSWLDQLD